MESEVIILKIEVQYRDSSNQGGRIILDNHDSYVVIETEFINDPHKMHNLINRHVMRAINKPTTDFKVLNYKEV
jgi:hypothetical protein